MANEHRPCAFGEQCAAFILRNEERGRPVTTKPEEGDKREPVTPKPEGGRS